MMEKLQQYLKENGYTHGAFGQVIGVSQVTINRYIRRDRFPSPEIIKKIETATSGAITVADWYEGV